MDVLDDDSANEKKTKLLNTSREFQTYIENNASFIPNYGERWRYGETISTAFVESTVNQVISKQLKFHLNQRTSVEDSRPLRVIVVGGSHSGLLTALALRAVNCDVEVFERSPHEMKHRGAGMVLQPETVQFLSSHGIATKEAISILPKSRQELGRDSKVIREQVANLPTTSRDCLYRQLRAAFPDQHYHKGNELVSFEQDENHVIGRFNNGQLITCDLLFCADGDNST